MLSTKNEQAQATRNIETEFLWEKKPKQNSKPKQQIINKIAHHQKKKTLNTHFWIGLQTLFCERPLSCLQRKEMYAEAVLEIQTVDSKQLCIFGL